MDEYDVNLTYQPGSPVRNAPHLGTIWLPAKGKTFAA